MIVNKSLIIPKWLFLIFDLKTEVEKDIKIVMKSYSELEKFTVNFNLYLYFNFI